jgi:ABC-2 type transport system permease protein
MIHTLRSESIKFRTVRTNLVLAIVATLFPIAVTTAFASFAKGDGQGPQPSSIFQFLTGSSIIMVMLLGVMGAVGITSEFSNNTIRPTFAATPKRRRVIAAKAIVTGGAAALVAVVVLVVGLGVSAAVLSARSNTASFADVDALPTAAIGLVVFSVLMALLGLGLGLLIRSSPGSIAVLILWPLLVENIVAGLLSLAGLDNARKWMPYAAGSALFRTDSQPDELGRLAGGLVLAAFVAVVLGLGSFSAARRDA